MTLIKNAFSHVLALLLVATLLVLASFSPAQAVTVIGHDTITTVVANAGVFTHGIRFTECGGNWASETAVFDTIIAVGEFETLDLQDGKDYCTAEVKVRWPGDSAITDVPVDGLDELEADATSTDVYCVVIDPTNETASFTLGC